MRKIAFISAVIFAAQLFLGCASPKEYVRGVLGISVQGLKHQKEGRYSLQCDLKYKDCYDKVLTKIKKLNALVFLENKKEYSIGASNFNSAFPRCLDATEVGIFFETRETQTKIDVASKNYHLAKFIHDELLSELGS